MRFKSIPTSQTPTYIRLDIPEYREGAIKEINDLLLAMKPDETWRSKRLCEMTSEEKVRRRIERNRASAAMSRTKKKAYISFLEQRVIELESELHALKEEKGDLLWENCLSVTIDDIGATTT